MSEAEERVCVFGAAGQVGRAIVANLIHHNTPLRTFERSEGAWCSWEALDGPRPPAVGGAVEHRFGDIVSYDAVSEAVRGCSAIIHTAVYFPPSVSSSMPDYSLPTAIADRSSTDREDQTGWLVNLKGLWNVLEAAREHNVQRVIHVGSAHAEDPRGRFNDADTRRGDGTLYATMKRLQEEMCRQQYDAFGTRILVLRPDYIVDGSAGVGRFNEPLPGHVCPHDGWVCRHDLAEAARLGLHLGADFDVLHVVSSTAPGRAAAEEVCNVRHTRKSLRWRPTADLQRFRVPQPLPKPQGAVEQQQATPTIVDSHCHVWSGDGDVWPTPEGVTVGDLSPLAFTVESLCQLMDKAGVQRAVLVTHNAYQGTDNSYVLRAVARFPHRFRACAILDGGEGSGNAYESAMVSEMRRLLPLGVTSLRIDPWKTGKAMLEGQRKDKWLYDAVWTEAATSGQCLCLLIDPADLPAVRSMCSRFPSTNVVLDHCARVGVGGRLDESDINALISMAELPRVHVKLSAFYALGEGRPPYADLSQLIQRLVRAYGWDRVLWGSDAPYQMEAARGNTYPSSLKFMQSVDGGDLSAPSGMKQLMGGTAEKLFFWDTDNDDSKPAHSASAAISSPSQQEHVQPPAKKVRIR